MIFNPHPYQKYAIDRIVSEDHVGLLLDMGLGKTAIVLHAIAELMLNQMVLRRVLIIAPKKVAEATWTKEAMKWDSTKWLKIRTALGTEKQRIDAVTDPQADVIVINRENVQWLVEWFDGVHRAWDFDLIVFDESSSFKNGQSKRFKAIRKVLAKTQRTVILTGTPAPNGLEDLWAQVYLLDRGERLGKYVSHFRERYFDYNPWRYELKPKTGAFDSVQNKISDICISMKAEDYLTLPEMIIEDHPVVLDRNGLAAYTRLEKEMLLPLGTGEEITATTAAALSGKLLQLCSGRVYDETGEVHEVHRSKYDMLGEVLEQMHGESVLIFYGFRHEVEPIIESARKFYPAEQIATLNGAYEVDAFNKGTIKVLLAHPASAGYGLNLQESARQIIWTTLTWNLELYQQANARLHRQGQKRPVIVHRLIVEGKLDTHVADALDAKACGQDAIMMALKAQIDSVKR